MTESALRNRFGNSLYAILLGCRIDADPLFVLAEFFESDHAINLGEQGVIPAAADVCSWMDFGAELSDDYRSGGNLLTAKFLDSPSLAYGIPSVSGASSCFLMSHFTLLYC